MISKPKNSIMTFDARLRHPFSMTIAGPSGSGKTCFVYSLLANASRLVDTAFDYVVCFLGSNDSKLGDLAGIYGSRIRFVKGLPDRFDDYIDESKNGFIVIDDLMNEGTKDERVGQLYTKMCHHLNVSVALILQNIFYHGKERYTILRNSHYLVIFNSPLDQSIARTLSYRLNPLHKEAVIKIFHYAQTKYRYLFLDGKQDTVAEARFRTDIFNPHFQRCFVIKNEGKCAEKERLSQFTGKVKKQKKEGFVGQCSKC